MRRFLIDVVVAVPAVMLAAVLVVVTVEVPIITVLAKANQRG